MEEENKHHVLSDLCLNLILRIFLLGWHFVLFGKSHIFTDYCPLYFIFTFVEILIPYVLKCQC